MQALDIVIEDPRWQSVGFEELAARAVRATLDHTGIAPDLAEISILACDDARIAALNAGFRERPVATNVLSWPSAERAAQTPGAPPQPPVADPDGTIALGDIAISYDTCLAEADAAGKPVADHVTHLVVHGLLHLLGYDHLRDPDATLMETTETTILGKLGIDDPY